MISIKVNFYSNLLFKTTEKHVLNDAEKTSRQQMFPPPNATWPNNTHPHSSSPPSLFPQYLQHSATRSKQI